LSEWVFNSSDEFMFKNVEVLNIFLINVKIMVKIEASLLNQTSPNWLLPF